MIKGPQTPCLIMDILPAASQNPEALLHQDYFIGINRYGPTSCIDLLLGVQRSFIKIPIRCTAVVVSAGVAALALKQERERLTTTFRPLLRAEFAHLLPGVTKNEEEEDVSAGGHQLTRTTNVT